MLQRIGRGFLLRRFLLHPGWTIQGRPDRAHYATGAPALSALLVIGALALPGCDHRPPTGGPIATTAMFGEVGVSPGQFSYPRCVAGDGSSLWVIDKQARLQQIDAKTGAWLNGWRMPEWQQGKPTGITVWKRPQDAAPLVFVADTHYHRIIVYRPGQADTPDLVTQFGSYGESDGQLVYPTDVAVLPSRDGNSIERLYVSEYGGHDRINVYEPAATGPDGLPTEFVFRFAFGRFGSGALPDPVEFNRPQCMEVDLAQRELVMTDACNHRIGRFTLEGALIKWIGGPDVSGKEPGQLSFPYGLALLGDGSVLVCEFGNNRLQRFDLATGASLGIYGEAGRDKGQLASPWGLAVIDGTVFVLDSGNNRVLGFAKPRGGVSREAASAHNTVAGQSSSTAGGPG